MEKVNNNSNDNSGADNVARGETKFMKLFREHCCDIFWTEGCESLEWLFRISVNG